MAALLVNPAGQLRFSQNAQQEADRRYAYIKYDPRGRVIETGLVQSSGTLDSLPDVPSLVAAGLTEQQARQKVDTSLKSAALQTDLPNAGTEQVVLTIYDAHAPACPSTPASLGDNLRGRVSAIVAQKTTIGDIATCYSYDPHGNVSTLVQRVPGIGDKRVDYDYDIIDGKILASHYQSGATDALHHDYKYDDDRRVSGVKSSRDGVLWEQDAAYTYYPHGALARVVLGADQVQGLDYLYTISGWPKGIDADSLDTARDPGGDGRVGGANAAVARDIFGAAVHYFPGDYAPVGAAARTLAAAPQLAFAFRSGNNLSLTDLDRATCETTPTDPSCSPYRLAALARASCQSAASVWGCGLYDGNVAATVQSVSPFGASGTLGTAYRYDQLYQLTKSTPSANADTIGNSWPPEVPGNPTPMAPWSTTVAYDGNGNITHLNRRAPDPAGSDLTGKWMDQLTYNYPLDAGNSITSNWLLHINDAVDAAVYPDDLDDQGQPFDPHNPVGANYAYDLSGRLTRDTAAGLNAISWNAASRVAAFTRANDALEFVYDGLGNRIAKITRSAPDPNSWQVQYFVRDGKGEVLATYKKEPPAAGSTTSSPSLVDQTIFGASRLGVWAPADPPWAIVTLGASGGSSSGIHTVTGGLTGTGSAGGPPTPVLQRFARVRGAKRYELANYLGNVIATIKDRKKEIPFGDPTGPPPTHYEVEVASASDYDPFGNLLQGHNQISPGGTAYRYGFSGLERDDDIKGAGNSYYTNARLFDPRVGRWLSPDPVQVSDSSPFVGFSNNPLRHSDPGGTAPGDSIKDKMGAVQSRTVIDDKTLVATAAWQAKQNRYAGLSAEQTSAWKDIDFGDWWYNNVEKPVLKPVAVGLRWTAGVLDPMGIVESKDGRGR